MDTILLIEEEEVLAVLVQTILMRRGRRVLLARSVREAKWFWDSQKEEIGMVIANDSLPDGSGINLVRQLHLEKPGLQVVITAGLLITRLPDEFALLRKPYELSELVRAIGAGMAGAPR